MTQVIKIFNLLAIASIYVINKVECANILAIFPTPSISHQVVYRPFMNELVKRGHHVTMMTTDPAYSKENRPQNLTELDVHDLSYKMLSKVLKSGTGTENENLSNMLFVYNMFQEIFEEQVKSPDVQKLINDKTKKFDILFIESCVRPSIVFSHIYKVPVIEMGSLGPVYQSLDQKGAVTNDLWYPTVLHQRIYNLTQWEKISELYAQYKAQYQYAQLEKTENKMLQRVFGQEIPNIRELKKNIQMLFLNTCPMWDFNRPVPPNVVYLGGLHLRPSKELPTDIKSYLDSSKNGVIYMSFGTNVKPSLLPPEKIQVFTKVFSQLPYNVLWKWDSDEIPGTSQNVKVSKWLPQSDLLQHPNVKLFITQGGLQSTDEAIAAGVPLIGVPMLGDQWFNVEMYYVHKIGVRLNIESITENSVKEAIESMMKDTTYRENVIKLRNRIRDQPQTSLERAVWWTEHVLRHGNAEHLRTPTAQLHWAEYYALDLVLILISIPIIFFIAITCVTYLIVAKPKFNIPTKNKIY